MANSIRLNLPETDERDIQLAKRQSVNFTAATMTNSITINIATSDTNTTAVTTITTMPTGCEGEIFKENFFLWEEVN